MNKANHIRLTANDNQSEELAKFLIAGRDMVAASEPNTIYWYSLRNESDAGELTIFDIFPDQAGRQAHFDGDVAKALMGSAPTLVKGGWEQGVLANARNYAVVGATKVEAPPAMTKATYIALEAAPGQAAALEQFLAAGAGMVAEHEPATAYWYALRDEDRAGHYAIFDLFADQAGRAAHFAGPVAAALKEKAGELVVGGWDDGVVGKVVNYDVLAAK